MSAETQTYPAEASTEANTPALPGGGIRADVGPGHTITGDLRLHEFPSQVFCNTRLLRVWLPEGYDAEANRERQYPVLYLNDGQNLFDAATSFIGVEWGVDETTDGLIRTGVIPPMIVVGVDNAQGSRTNEYLPYVTRELSDKTVNGKNYPRFLMKEVMPFIQQTYRVKTGPENTGLGGSSLGALITLYTVMAKPGVFGRILLESPSLFVCERKVLRQSKSTKVWPQRVFVAIGTNETERERQRQAVIDDVLTLEKHLLAAGLGGDRLQVVVDVGATHNEGEWAKRLPAALAFLFST